MFRWMKWIAPVAGLALLVGYAAQSRADDPAVTPAPAGKATITVTVVDKDGKPVDGAMVALLPPKAKGQKGGAAPTAGGNKQNKPQPIATANTDKDGKAVLTGIANGNYMVNARLKGTGQGNEKVSVVDDKDATVTVTLKPHQPKGGAGGGNNTPTPTPAPGANN
jgi:Carboxypeptidase regulatory-like domain